MKTEFAFSLDCNFIVDSDEAYELYWLGIIKHQRNFECIGEDCHAQITCANIYKLEKDMVVPPYFKVHGEHSENCSYQPNKIQPYSPQRNNNISKSRGIISDEFLEILHLERPPSHLERRRRTLQLHPEQQSNLSSERKKSEKEALSRLSQKPKNRHCIRPIVNNFREYRQEKSLETKYIQIKNATVPYADLFIKINSQNINNLPKYPRIYWGQANLYDNKTHYNILFSDYLSSNDELIRPSIYVNNKLIEEAFNDRLIEKNFQELSGSCIYCFVYAKPCPKPKNGKNYINFYPRNLDFLEIKKEFHELPILYENHQNY